ncbi:MAG: hypothetical protein PHE83_01900 [Opitutaceae bacterium]|nr:hypothetical protein [Opitutaceae bacterium]
MPLRTRLLPVTFVLLCAWLTACSVSSEAERHAEKVAEADRLYRRANDYITHVREGQYSYAYMQFYWKRSQANVDRILRSYADTPVGARLKAGGLKLGPYELSYFKERVLPWLEVKRLAAYDKVNCAIFLYNTDEQRWDDVRLAAFARIIEVLSRQKRWSEALIFPILPEYRPLLLGTMFRIATRFNQGKVVDELLVGATPDEQAVLFPILGESLAVRGVPRTEIVSLLDEHPQDAVKLGVLSGMIQRELKLQRAAALHLPFQHIVIQGGGLEQPEVRDDVEAEAREFFPGDNREAARLLAEYRAALGDLPAARQIAATAGLDDLTGVYLAHLDHLAAFGKFDELAAFMAATPFSGDQRRQCALKTIELLARTGRTAESEQALQQYLDRHALGDSARADAARLQWFRGRMQARDESQLVVREHTFADLPIKDPCVMAQVIMEWSLTPNSSIRGAAPWDCTVTKYAGGFENLPEPKARDVQRAAAELLQY